jgi:class 3 adenylate cyclase
MIAAYRSVMQNDLRAVLPSIRVPTLVVHRADDPHIRVAHGRYLAEHIPRARFVEVPGADYSPFFAGDVDVILDEVEEFLTGSRATPEADRVLATLLFTDLVDSTRQTAELGDRRWGQLLDAHNDIVRQLIGKFRGREVRTTGDGFVATFDGPARAIRCAQAIAAQIRALGLESRAGLHTGEIEMRGGNLGGLAFNLAARVMAEAGPGECLVSSTVKDLVVGSGIEFEDRGSHELKGVPGEWHLYAVKS